MVSRTAVYIVCLVLVAAAFPMALRWVAPNGAYGFRTAQTLSSPDIWYRANSFAGWLIIAIAIAMAAAAFLLPEDVVQRHAQFPLVILIVGLTGIVVGSAVYLARIS